MSDSPSKRRYDAEYTRLFALKVNRKTEADILDRLQELDEPVAAYLKRLIREDIEKGTR